MNEGLDEDRLRLHEMVRERRHKTIVPSGYRGKPGDILLLRLLPPFLPEHRLALAPTTPYHILLPSLLDWKAYFNRTLPTLGADRVKAYETLMKYGTRPQGPRYWTEYIFEGYVNHRSEVIFLQGLPDVAESRPHSKAYSPPAAEAKLRTLAGAQSSVADRPAGGSITRYLSPTELARLPKLSQVLLKFGRPMLDGLPPGTSEAELQQAMDLVAFAWNLPLIRQGSDPESSRSLVQRLEAAWPHLPPEAQRSLKAMMTDRETTYRGDPRLATVTVKLLGDGEVRVHAEARVLGNPG